MPGATARAVRNAVESVRASSVSHVVVVELEERPVDTRGAGLRHPGVAHEHVERAGLAGEPLRPARGR